MSEPPKPESTPQAVKPKKPRAKRMSEDKTLVKVKAMRRILKTEGEKAGYQIRISPEFIDAFDERVREQFAASLERMRASKCKTLMLPHV